MIAQQHKIMRQVIEARGCSEAAAPRIRAELREAYYRRLVPLIEKVCSDLSAPGRIHRVDRLEIDLGEVPPEALEAALAGRFEAAFSRALAAALGDSPAVDSDLELFGHFIRTGTVPWWTDLSDRGVIVASVERLIRRAPQALRQLLRAAPDPERARRRIVLACPDGLLDALAGVVAPSLSASCPSPGGAWLPLLRSFGGGAINLWWEELLRTAAAFAADGAGFEAPRFFGALLRRVARRLHVDYRVLVADLRRALDEPALATQPWLRDILESLRRERERDAPATREPRHEVMNLVMRLREVLHRLPARLRQQTIAALEADHERALAGLMRDAREHGFVAPETMSSVALSELAARLLDAVREPAAAARKKDTPATSSFSDADEIYLENAGLVILWPFLATFFASLGLLEEKIFKDEASRQRAVGLLQYLATGEAPGPEQLLPLNKLLCGMELEEVFDFGPPMTEAEIEACDDLLSAAIHHAPILRDMSIPGFRASFLLRSGQLSARDDHWLVRVERLTHDVVLDRFPWSVHIVKLPWMQAVMQVEW